MKQESIALSCFGELLATKCVFPDNQIFIARPTLIYLNPDKCRFKFDGTKCNLKQKWNEDNKCRCKCNRPRKTIVYAKTIMLGILAYIFLRLGKI